MGRPPMPIGTAGKVKLTELPDGAGHLARCKFRDYDGKVRPVERSGRTKRAAEHNLKIAIRDRQGPQGGKTITRETKLGALADLHIKEVWASERAIGTKQHYDYVARTYVKPALAHMKIGEANVGLIDLALQAIADRNGKSAAKSTRSVLSGMFKLAARHQAISYNPVRDTTTITMRREKVRSLTVEETDYLRAKLAVHKRAIELDLPDLVDFMLGTGCRIGEACAARDELNAEGQEILQLQEDSGTWEVNATVVREDGVGLFVQEWTKSDAGWRVLALPEFVVHMIHQRRKRIRRVPPRKVVFGSATAKALRDPSNTPGHLREVLDSIDCPSCAGTCYVTNDKGRRVKCEDAGPFKWVHSHTFRKTVATRMDEAGCTAREIADQLGHRKPSMTQDVYMGRGVVSAKAAKVLELLAAA